MKTLVLGLGNPLVTDDSVGLRVAAALRERLGKTQEGRHEISCRGDFQSPQLQAGAIGNRPYEGCEEKGTGTSRPREFAILGDGGSEPVPFSSATGDGTRSVPATGAPASVEIGEDYWGGLRLMERLIGYDRAIIVDAIQTGGPPGTIHLLTPDDVPTQHSASAHDVNLPTALEFGRRAGMHLPENRHILLVGIEAADILTIGEQCTPAVEAAIPVAVEAVLEALQRSNLGDPR